jgi:hypothetical protein
VVESFVAARGALDELGTGSDSCINLAAGFRGTANLLA